MGSRALIANWSEIAGSLLGLANIVLLMRRSVWNFPVAMLMVALVGITLYEQRLYSETLLQAFFFVVNGWGWWLWSRARDHGESTVPVGWMSDRERFYWAAITAVLSLGLGWFMAANTNAALPYADATVTGASIAAQFLLSLRRIENWVLWVAIDVISIALYVNRELYYFAALYVVFLILSVQGLREWRAAAR
ncbi:nicotinamide riboside transporter PnuC [Novosphingobium sp.]|uniref:nicotinamide riboside transporter PnuC n=1 Tax=Novosphingobium sp. TaxID=1874826 RepID=UPI0035B49B61